MNDTKTNKITYREAVRQAIREAMIKDDRVFLMGEDVGMYGGSFAVSTRRERFHWSRDWCRTRWNEAHHRDHDRELRFPGPRSDRQYRRDLPAYVRRREIRGNQNPWICLKQQCDATEKT